MESVVSEPRKRGRKRKRVDVTQNMGDGSDAKVDNSKRRVIETRSNVFLGRYVKKEFEGSGVFLGKILSYDRGLYRVDYEDGDCEDLESSEVRRLAILDSEFEGDWSVRKVQLDRLIAVKYAKAAEESKNNEGVVNEVAKVEAPLHSKSDELKQDDDYDSLSDSSEYEVDKEYGVMERVPIWPPPQLPLSSGNVGLPEEFVSLLFSVYCFLRSFSIRLFLSPFGLDEFVGSLNCVVPNTLLDAIHVAMLRLLRRHLEASSSDGSELASKCLRSIDWSLLDTLTWPVYLVHYLIVMDYTTGHEWKGFFNNALEGEYYNLPVGRKLIILQILCDNIIDSEELRAEMDMREESEVGLDSELTMTTRPENGPRRVHPRYSKTSACKEQEAMQIIAESGDTKRCYSSKSVHARGSELAADSADVDLDANGDECRLCGMDGTLLCCDGCPSAYHSRCIGVVKMYIPEGPWFCPECVINKTEPTITKGTFLRGAEVFGVDSYGKVFLGTCDHLLVFNISADKESCPRYYNHNDIPKVLQVLSSEQHADIYYGICNAIQHYWEIPSTILLMPDRIDSVRWPNTSIPLSVNGGDNVAHVVDVDHFASSAAKSRIERTTLPCPDNGCEGTQNCFGMQPQLSALLNDGGSGDKQGNPSTEGQSKMESFAPKDSLSQQANQSEISGPDLDDRSSIAELSSTSADHRMSSHQYVGGTISATNIYHQTIEVDRVGGRANSSITEVRLYMGSSYKSQMYTNNYVHGEFAASAAANLTILSSEEMSTETLTSGNLRKTVSENIMQQVKAFSSAAIRFFWPISERKLAEVPRERCGWCFACKAPVSSKKACLLNSAVSNATRGALKILSGLRPIKSREGTLPNIAMYILFMEESLRGLVIGPFLNGSFRKRWCKEVEQASTCSAIMGLLLQLEENISLVAFSADWLKLVDDSSVGSSVAHNATNAVALTQKRGPGRRSKKHFALSEVTSDDCPNKFYCWWRGGRLSKNIFQKGILPHKMIRKAARLGGSGKIPGVGYSEGSEIPKRSRQCVWRAAVEMCKNTSQLALQVRYLDLHIRWADLTRPEQIVQDGKGPETEAAAFRNASIADKKFVENKIIYEVAFENQKHLPSRVMKNKIAIDQCHDRTEKYWFYETHIPLYLIKEYEQQQSAKLFTPVSTMQPSIALSKLQRIQLKAPRKDVYTYLTCKGKEKCFCASCHLDVLIRSAVKCSTCEGYCHAHCTTSSKVHTGEEVEFLTTCKRCSRVQMLAQNENRNGSPRSPLPVQVQEYQNAVSVTKSVKKKNHNHPLASGGAPDSGSNNKKKTTGSSSWATKSKQRKLCNWGLIWRKKNIQDTGIDFRLRNIMLKGSPDVSLCKPVCHLCHGPYNSNLMYIRCETCGHWYHADAVELEESKIFDLVGFKCCKCRRIRSPACPYMDPKSRRLLEARKPRVRSSKQGNSGSDSIVSDSAVSEEPGERDLATPLLKEDVILGQNNDPLIFSLERVEHIADQNLEADFEWGTAPALGPQKLPVRRQAKREGDADGFPAVDPLVILETKGSELKEEPLSHLEWDASANDFEDDFMFDCEDLYREDMEFEPQTYFSFQELLPSEDCSPLDGIDASADASVACEISSMVSPSRISAQPDLGLSNGVPCGICLGADLAPHVCCEVCKLCVHQHCCPWEEYSSSHGGWKCGNCREWR
ncbi:Zinc finger, PHD-finger [Dillenia turbinata]|uniref:Zinc finger, PHD-finger n=1 Tax=Dillenia turbinata TaxID=194707 RepID=A0AAN8VAP7_9MAGN